MNHSCNYFHIKTPLKLLVKSLLHSDFALINQNTQLHIKQLAEPPQQILANYVYIS